MLKKIAVGSIILSCLFYLSSCKPGTSSNDSIATDSVSIAVGERSFNINCSGCHNFRQDAIGPQLSGVTNAVSAEWITNFVKDPQQLINSKDVHAVQLHDKYKTTMPSFSWLKEDEIKNIIPNKEIMVMPDTIILFIPSRSVGIIKEGVLTYSTRSPVL